jgi:transcriptional regulator with XRE-family HTH domain
VPVESVIMRQLIRLRQKRNIRPSEVARRMGVARQSIYNTETMRQGYPNIRTLERYAKAIGAEIVVREKG